MRFFKLLLVLVAVLTPTLSLGQNGFWTDRAVGTAQFNGFTGLVPISYGQVRVCTFPASGNPCTPLATVFDINGNILPISGGNFGQVTTDVVGRFSFQAAPGSYLIQVAAGSSNTPALQYPISIATTSSIVGTIILTSNNVFTGTNTFQNTTTFSALVNAKNIESIRYADQFPGADCGAKIMAADADFPFPNGEIWVNRNCGLTLSTALNVTHSVRFIEGGTWNLSTTWLQTHGGIDIIGQGLTDAGSGAGTQILWTGAAGQDMLSMLGTAINRMDRVNIRNLIIDGGNVARYPIRFEKIDTSSIYDSRIRNGTECNIYSVDATGLHLFSVDFSRINRRALCLDWGSGGFVSYGSNFEQLVTGSTGPMILIQGAINNVAFFGSQMDASHGAFVGFIQITGFLVNSSLPSAPAGGAGNPTTIDWYNLSTFYDNGDVTTPSQGADALVTGVGGIGSINVKFHNSFFGGGSISAVAVKTDIAQEVGLDNCLSSGHTTGLASTLQATVNSTRIRMFGTNSLDTNRIAAGGSAASVVDMFQAPSGQWNESGALVITGGVNSWLTLPSGAGDPSALNTSLFFRSDSNRLRYLDNVAVWHSVVATDTIDTLTNKTLTSPSLSLPTNTSAITIALGTVLIGANSCAAAATGTITGISNVAGFSMNFLSDPNSVTGYGSGGLQVTAWPTANTVNVRVCNPTAVGITPGAMSVRIVPTSIT